jgi:uncharacterized damage-inducible protein DinB
MKGWTMSQRNQRTISPLPASHPELGRWLWALEDTRRRTLEALDGITQEELDWTPAGLTNSIGTLLYHNALIETDYLCIDILGMDDYFPDLMALLPFPDRDEAGELVAVTGVALPEHLARLDTVRRRFLDHVSTLTAEQMDTPRPLPEWNYDISPAWTIHHLMQHEAEHRGEITSLRTLFRAKP